MKHEMSTGRAPDSVVEREREVSTRDGALLCTDVIRPLHDEPVPVLLQRTPYGRSRTSHLHYAFDLLRALREGWAVVIQDVRGRGASPGEFEPFRHEAADGHDTVDWIVAQPWCDGTVATVGGSYLGATQWLLATSQHPALRAIAPALTPDDYYDGWALEGGIPRLGFSAHWLYGPLWPDFARRAPEPDGGTDAGQRLAAALRSTGPDRRSCREPVAPFTEAWHQHPHRDSYWTTVSPRERWRDITVPAFNTGGWFDLFLDGTVRNFVGMQHNGGSEVARTGQRLVVGPWTHGQFAGTYADEDFGPSSSAEAIDLTGLQLRWLDHYVRGVDNGAHEDPAVLVFVMGENTWRSFSAWPPAGSTEMVLHLSCGDLSLRPSAPETPAERAFAVDAADPVPTVGGATFLAGRDLAVNAGPRDQHRLAPRDEILRFVTPPLDDAVVIVGAVEVDLCVRVDAVDGDLNAKLVVVTPDGRELGMLDGALRLSLRHGLAEPVPLGPGAACQVSVELGHTALAVPSGARLRLDIAGANFPRLDLNDTVRAATTPGAPTTTVQTGPGSRCVLRLDVLTEDPAHHEETA